MSTGELEQTSVDDGSSDDALLGLEKPKLNLEVDVTDQGACRKHLKVSISRDDIERQFEESLSNLGKDAVVPGFRPGHAPKTLLQRRFRKEVSGQVKTALVAASLDQIEKEHKIRPISTPNLDFEAIELPDLGPLRFELDLEVQPDFPLPNYKNLTVKRPVKDIKESDVDAELKEILIRVSTLVPKFEGVAEPDDVAVVSMVFNYQGVLVKRLPEEEIRITGKDLRMQDTTLVGIMDALTGTKQGDVRTLQALVDATSPDPALRGKQVDVTIQVLDLKSYRTPELTREVLLGFGCETVEELRDEIKKQLDRRFKYQQDQAIRQSIFEQLYAQHPFDMPPEMLKKQEDTVFHRRVLEMREANLSEAEIRSRLSYIRAYAARYDAPRSQGVFHPDAHRRGRAREGWRRRHRGRSCCAGCGLRRIAKKTPLTACQEWARGRPGGPDPRAEDDRQDSHLRELRRRASCPRRDSFDVGKRRIGNRRAYSRGRGRRINGRVVGDAGLARCIELLSGLWRQSAWASLSDGPRA